MGKFTTIEEVQNAFGIPSWKRRTQFENNVRCLGGCLVWLGIILVILSTSPLTLDISKKFLFVSVGTIPIGSIIFSSSAEISRTQTRWSEWFEANIAPYTPEEEAMNEMMPHVNVVVRIVRNIRNIVR